MRTVSLNDTLHGVILRALESEINEIFTADEMPQQNLQEYQLSAIFYNFRIKNGIPVGLRLSPVGNNLLSKKYNNYKYQHNKKLNHKTLLSLDKNMSWPYYITKTYVTFYNHDDAAWFRLNGNCLSTYIEYFEN